MNIFIICPVREVTKDEQEFLLSYVRNLESNGHSVHYPPRDTNQNDPQGGIGICMRNIKAIRRADRVDIYYKSKSQGTFFDLGVVMTLRKPLFLINTWDVKRTEGKSFENVILDMNGRSM